MWKLSKTKTFSFFIQNIGYSKTTDQTVDALY